MPTKQKKRQWSRAVRIPANKSAIVRLKTLPQEIVARIVLFLGPVALVSLSQASRHFRRIISPGRAEFIERLLALECLDKHGGSTSIIHARVCPRPAFSNAEWDAVKWACTSCMRLLPHVYFDNHAILRLGNRKPVPGTPAGEATTNWRISLRGKVHGGKAMKAVPPLELNQRHRGQKTKDDWLHPENVSRHLERLQEAGINVEAMFGDASPTLEAKQAAMDKLLDSMQLHRWGFKRHLRKCLECRYRAGQLNQHVLTFSVPFFQRSRQFLYAGMLERYFPQYWTFLKNQRPQLPHDGVMEVWTTHMGRCNRCSLWQELRSFRLGLTRNNQMVFPDQNWEDWEIPWEDYFEGVSCNYCIAKTQGYEVLGEILLEWINKLITEEENRLYQSILLKGFENAKRSVLCISDAFSEQRSQLVAMFEAGGGGLRLSKSELGELLARHHKGISILWEELLSQDIDFALKFGENTPVTSWVRKLSMYEAYRVWLGETSRELNQRPMALVRWAMNQNRAC